MVTYNRGEIREVLWDGSNFAAAGIRLEDLAISPGNQSSIGVWDRQRIIDMGSSITSITPAGIRLKRELRYSRHCHRHCHGVGQGY